MSVLRLRRLALTSAVGLLLSLQACGDDGGPTGTDPENEPPQISITAPSDGAEFTVGTTVTLTGVASDAEDGDLSSAIAWSSDVDGALGSGATVDADLSVATHTIQASVTDSEGSTADASIQVQVSEPPPNELTVVTDESVQLSPELTSGMYAADQELEYSVQAAPGFENLVVVLDSMEVAPTGTIRMDSPHVFAAMASRIKHVLPPDDPPAQRLQSAFDSPRPEFSYQHFLDEVALLAEQVSTDSLRTHLRTIENWLLEDDARVAEYLEMDRALAGHVFQWREPASSDGPGGAGARTTQGTIPPVATGPNVEVVFINGIMNSLRQAMESQTELSGLLQTGADLDPSRTSYSLVYSPSAPLPFISENSCQRKLLAEVLRRPTLLLVVLSLPRVLGQAKLESALSCSFVSDPIEALAQIFDETVLKGWLQDQGASFGASESLADRIRALHGDDRAVVVVAHSQGNLMTAAALRSLDPPGDGGSLCTSYVGVAAPGVQNPGQASPVDRLTVAGSSFRDLMLILFGNNDSDLLATNLSSEYDESLWTQFANVVSVGWVSYYVGYKLHSFNESYLGVEGGPQTRAWMKQVVESQAQALDAACRGGIRATILDASTGEPVSGSVMSVLQHQQPPSDFTADQAGNVAASGLALRPSILRFTAEGYDTVTLGPLEPELQASREAGTVLLTPLGAGDGTLGVTVRDHGLGSPVPGATVRVSQGGATVAEWTTSSQGTASGTVPAGTYELSAEAAGYRPGEASMSTVVENTETEVELVLVAENTADFTGNWVYAAHCGAGLGFVDAELAYEQTGAQVTGTIRIQSSNQGGGWIRVEGTVVERTITGNSTGWIEENPNWTLNQGWQQTLSADGNRIEGATPITGCPEVGWDRYVPGQSVPSRTEGVDDVAPGPGLAAPATETKSGGVEGGMGMIRIRHR